MITVDWKVYFGLVILILGMVLGIPIGRCSKSVQAPAAVTPPLAVKERVDTVIIYKPDTVKKYYTKTSIRFIHDTVEIFPGMTNVEGKFTVDNCFTLEDSSNGAHAKMTMCSKEFPSEKPEDIHGSLELALPADTAMVLSKTKIEKGSNDSNLKTGILWGVFGSLVGVLLGALAL